MNQLLLQPSDVLFFKDGRPMSGSLAGHGAAWPLPHTLHGAFHAALHRAQLKDAAHAHRPGRNGVVASHHRDRHFGSLQSVGPFPVDKSATWFFPRPLDANDESGVPTLKPVKLEGDSSLPCPLTLVVENTGAQSKDKPAAWWSAKKFADYLKNAKSTAATCADADIFGAEHAIGIGISPETGTQDGERFYTASYLRLKDGWRLGTLAATSEKNGHDKRDDLIGDNLFKDSGLIVTGGQQRLCRVEKGQGPLPLPGGLTSGFATADGTHRVKWVLLTPAIFQQVGAHPGGWLPTWIDQKTGAVLLPRGDRSRRHTARETRVDWRNRLKATAPFGLSAKLVAACTGKPLAVTGWSLEQGAKSTHLAVPAGSVYYFECDTAEAARDLAAALNWHGATTGPATALVNRRSGIFGEKGFGLGLCGTW